MRRPVSLLLRRRTGAGRRIIGQSGLVLLAGVMITGSALAAGPQYSVIYGFHGGQDGYYPLAAMTADRAGNLYGTTSSGGTTGPCAGQPAQGCGTVFQLTSPTTGTVWTETVLYRFQGGNDGAAPDAPLIVDAAGNLYGTTSAGGSTNCSGGCGTVFELLRPPTPGGAWTERVLYRFQGVPSGNGDGDAASPNGLVFDSKGNLYGTADSGGHCFTDPSGTYCNGAVYKLVAPSRAGAAWTEHVLYIFHDPSGAPSGPILDAAGNLYGSALGGQSGFGMVFELARPTTPGGAWTETAIHNFQGSDGAFPAHGLIFDQAGRLYGATMGSPAYNNGTVYQLSPPSHSGSPWTEVVLYTFSNGAAGSSPNGGLILSHTGTLYGTTQWGGQHGAGTVFALTPPAPAGVWTETILHSFAAGHDGVTPYGGLTMGKSGALYGATSGGGSNGSGHCVTNGVTASCGIVFQVVP